MFLFPDGMIGANLENFGTDIDGSLGTVPGLDPTNPAASAMAKIGEANGFAGGDAFVGESYDAAALIILAMQAGGSADRASIAKNVMGVANGPGTKIYPGELKKGLDLLAKGKKVDYEGATGVTFTSVGEAEGSFLEQEVKGGKFKTKKQR